MRVQAPQGSPGSDQAFGLHWIGLTFFQDLESTQDWVGNFLLDELNQGLPLRWVDKGPAGRSESILHWGANQEGSGVKACLQVPRKSQQTYTLFELRGDGCDEAGTDRLGAFLRYLSQLSVRWHARRLDLKWDRVAFTPQDLRDAARGGCLVSRIITPKECEWRENEEGRTWYGGLRVHKKTRMVRCYDCRGFTRLELELHGDDADDCLRALAQAAPADWSRIALGYLLRTIDFRELETAARTNRAERVPWWGAFVGTAEAVQALQVREDRAPQDLTALGRAELLCQRVARRVQAIIDGLGSDWFLDRVRHYAGKGMTDQDRAFAESLVQWRGFAEAFTETTATPAPF